MELAVRHNNAGISLLEQGLHEQALAEFKLAAQYLYTITQDIKEKGLRRTDKQEFATACTLSLNPIVTDNLFIRSAPVMLSLVQEPTVASHCTIESAVILMNMALTYHVDSRKPHCLKDALQCAMTLYDMAYGLSLRVHEDPRSSHIILTSLNNLGQIHFDIGDYTKSEQYFNDLSTYVMFLGPAEESNAEHGRRECILNAMVLRNPNTSAAAA